MTRASNDIETALYTLLTADQKSASAHAVPANLGESLPHIHVVATGGYTDSMVVESHNVDFDVYAATDADAMEEATALCDWVRGLPGSDVGTFCYGAEVITLPYHNPDPRNYSFPRVTFKTEILTRTRGA